jgi:hypothetical protein
MLAFCDALRRATPNHRRGDYGETMLWIAVAILDLAMFVLCAMSANADLSLAQTAIMLICP